MKNNCKKCGGEISSFSYGLCYVCEDKEEKMIFVAILVLCLFVFITIVGFRIVWAKYIYKDARCAFAECRIQVNP